MENLLLAEKVKKEKESYLYRVLSAERKLKELDYHFAGSEKESFLYVEYLKEKEELLQEIDLCIGQFKLYVCGIQKGRIVPDKFL